MGTKQSVERKSKPSSDDKVKIILRDFRKSRCLCPDGNKNLITKIVTEAPISHIELRDKQYKLIESVNVNKANTYHFTGIKETYYIYLYCYYKHIPEVLSSYISIYTVDHHNMNNDLDNDLLSIINPSFSIPKKKISNMDNIYNGSVSPIVYSSKII